MPANETDPLKATPEQAERAHKFAHDLRNRLAAIQQILVQLKETAPDAGSNELIDFAEQQYFKAMRATEDLLDDLQVERGVGTMQLAPIDMAKLVEQAIGSMQHRFARKHQVVRTALATSVQVNGDAHWMEELLCALLSNASKFTPEHGTMNVSLAIQGDSAIVQVQDSGVGLDAEDLAGIFTRYAWLKSRSTSGEAQARSTLGRALQWAEAHGGSLTATSAGPGAGSTFSLALPLLR